MKIFCIENTYLQDSLLASQLASAKPIVSMKPDTALLRNNQAFYYPDFTQDLVARVGVLLRIDRVGRSIAEKFAARYCGAVGVAVDLLARDVLTACREQGLPWEAAKAFDYSLPVSQHMIPVEGLDDLRNIDYSMAVNGASVQMGSTGSLLFPVEQIIAHVSALVTLKMGDLIYVGGLSPAYQLVIGDRLQASIGEEILLDFEIK